MTGHPDMAKASPRTAKMEPSCRERMPLTQTPAALLRLTLARQAEISACSMVLFFGEKLPRCGSIVVRNNGAIMAAGPCGNLPPAHMAEPNTMVSVCRCNKKPATDAAAAGVNKKLSALI